MENEAAEYQQDAIFVVDVDALVSARGSLVDAAQVHGAFPEGVTVTYAG